MSGGAMLTREQRRARLALETWRETAGKGALREDYKTLVNGFGAQVLRSGLLAAVAFARRYRNKDAADHMLDALFSEHVMSVDNVTKIPASGLIDAIAALDAGEYMIATREVLAALLWLRRAAQGAGDVRSEGGSEEKK